jgi:phage terminase small subunit
MSLAFRQRRFVNEYLVKLNAAKAAIRAGYSPKTAKSQGSRLLTNVDVNLRKSAGYNYKMNIGLK